jgi:hypothetical protein
MSPHVEQGAELRPERQDKSSGEHHVSGVGGPGDRTEPCLSGQDTDDLLPAHHCFDLVTLSGCEHEQFLVGVDHRPFPSAPAACLGDRGAALRSRVRDV